MKKLKIFVVIGYDYTEDEGNPFVRTIEYSILKRHDDISFSSVRSQFWEDDNWDIVHVMWPDCFVPDMRGGLDLRSRLEFLQKRGTKIIATVHNMISHHAQSNKIYADSYDIVYSMADVMVHLGEYSKSILEKKYPEKMHVLIPHHVYDQLYTNIPSKQEALKHFHYKDGTYVLVMGGFRHSEERALVFKVMKLFPDIKFAIPKFYDIPKWPINRRWFKQRIKHVYYNLKYPNLYCKHEDFVSDEDIPYYFALSDITFIQRLDTLNSGNLPLGMLMGNVIVGPKTGNIGLILNETNNFAFKPNDNASIQVAMREALKAAKNGLGHKNQEMALSAWNTQHIAECHYNLYKSLCTSE